MTETAIKWECVPDIDEIFGDISFSYQALEKGSLLVVMHGKQRDLVLKFPRVIALRYEDDCPGFDPLPSPLPTLKNGRTFPTLKIEQSDWLSQWAPIYSGSSLKDITHFALISLNDLVQIIAMPAVEAYWKDIKLPAVQLALNQEKRYEPHQFNKMNLFGADSNSKGAESPKNNTKVIDGLKQSAEQGFVTAQTDLGLRYKNGKGLPQDYKLAAEWLHKAANQNNVRAQFTLASLYEDGLGVPQNYQIAAEWYIKAADKGFAPAQNNLGVCFATGQGVDKSVVIAYALYCTALEPYINAKMNYIEIQKLMSADEITAGSQLILEMTKPGSLVEAIKQYQKKLPLFESRHLSQIFKSSINLT